MSNESDKEYILHLQSELSDSVEYRIKLEKKVGELQKFKDTIEGDTHVGFGVYSVDDFNAMEQFCRESARGLGGWMSAALSDDNVCQEFKADIKTWMDLLGKTQAWKNYWETI